MSEKRMEIEIEQHENKEGRNMMRFLYHTLYNHIHFIFCLKSFVLNIVALNVSMLKAPLR